jgi:hypothetical protein
MPPAIIKAKAVLNTVDTKVARKACGHSLLARSETHAWAEKPGCSAQ